VQLCDVFNLSVATDCMCYGSRYHLPQTHYIYYILEGQSHYIIYICISQDSVSNEATHIVAVVLHIRQ